MNVSNVLTRLGINHKSTIIAVQEVSALIQDAPNPCLEASTIFRVVLDQAVRFDDAVYARVAAKAMIAEVISAGCEIDDAELFVDEAREYADKFCADPKWSFLWAKPEAESTTKVENVVQVVDNVDIKVAVKADGKIKKGGKQVLAFDMYRINVVEAEVPLTNQEFISLLMDKLDMSKAGATTYAYNAKNHFFPKAA